MVRMRLMAMPILLCSFGVQDCIIILVADLDVLLIAINVSSITLIRKKIFIIDVFILLL